MYSYQPPKSSIWGHKLGKISATRERTLFADFLARAIATYTYSSGSLSVAKYDSVPNAVDLADPFLKRFEQATGTTSTGGYFAGLTREQSNRCIDELISFESESAYVNSSLIVTLGQAFGISAWRIAGREIATNSLIRLNYGKLPAITTFFTFETVEHFQYIKQVLGDLKLCKLNEKHLKERKTKSTKSSI